MKHMDTSQFLNYFSKISPYTIYAAVLIVFAGMFNNRRIATLALTSYMGRLGLSILVVLAGFCHKLIGVAAVFAIVVLHNIIFMYEPFESIDESTKTSKKQQINASKIKIKDNIESELDDHSTGNNTDSIEGYATLEIERSLYGKNSSEF